VRLQRVGARLVLGRRVDTEQLAAEAFDEIVLACGVKPRVPDLPGIDHPKVVSYLDVLSGRRTVGERVAIIGAGGIGFDVAEFLVAGGHSTTLDLPAWMAEWGVGDPAVTRGGLATPHIDPPAREVTLLQRKAAPLGKGLGKTTGWIHRAALRAKRVTMIGGVNYESVDERGLHLSFGEQHEKPMLLEVDTVVLCSGQEPLRDLEAPLRAAGASVHLIGGADVASELDAKRAIDQASRLAARL